MSAGNCGKNSGPLNISSLLLPDFAQRLLKYSAALREDLKDLCQDREFKDLLRYFSAERLQKRIQMYQARLDKVLDQPPIIKSQQKR